MELMDAIYRRRAVRSFTSAPVTRGELAPLIDAAVQAPSAINEQPWLFSVVLDRSRMASISGKAKQHTLRTSVAALAPNHFDAILTDPKFDIFYGAPVLILISAVKDGPWAVADCALAAENLMLAARDVGLGTCWIGFAQGWLGTPEGKATLDLPADCIPVAPIIVGHPTSDPATGQRNAPVVQWLEA